MTHMLSSLADGKLLLALEVSVYTLCIMHILLLLSCYLSCTWNLELGWLCY